MKRINATEYYYFNKKYFDLLVQNKYAKIIFISYNMNIIGASLIFIYDIYIHYHLSCNDGSWNCITDFMLVSIMKELKPKLFILGGGLIHDDDLSKFKKKLSNREYTYNIYINILNNKIYNELLKN